MPHYKFGCDSCGTVWYLEWKNREELCPECQSPEVHSKVVDDEDDTFQVDDEVNLMDRKDELLEERLRHIKQLQNDNRGLKTGLRQALELIEWAAVFYDSLVAPGTLKNRGILHQVMSDKRRLISEVKRLRGLYKMGKV